MYDRPENILVHLQVPSANHDALERSERLRRQSEPEPEAQQKRERNLTDYEMARWRQYFEGHTRQAALAERKFILDVLGETLGQERVRQRAEMDAAFRQVPPGAARRARSARAVAGG
jgi:hypothetical protein